MAKGEKYVNVPRDIEDDFYRYKMPVLRAKVEGRGNGIKTVVENMADIAKALERPSDYPTKFFGFELGALTKVDTENDKHIVNGKHEASDLAKVLDSFIAKYVLCSACRNPETEMVIKGENIGLRCRACGATTNVDPTHKLTTYIVKNPPRADMKKEAAVRKDKKARDEKKSKVVQDKDADDDDNWVLDTSKEAVEARRKELLGNAKLAAGEGEEEDGAEEGGDAGGKAASGGKTREKKKEEEEGKEEDKVVVAKDGEAGTALQLKPGANPLKLLQEFWSTKPDDIDIIKQVTGLAAREKWSESQLLKTVFGSLFDQNFRKDFYSKAETLALFVNGDKEQKLLLYCIEKLCQMDPHVINSIADILHGFWEEDLLDEALLIKWYNHPNKRMDPKLSRKIRDGSKVFIEWLQNAEEEESEEF